MKANEFVKKFGLSKAKEIFLKSKYYHEVDVYLVDTKEFVFIAIPPDENDPYVSIDELKRLVESHERLKEEYGTLENAKEHLKTISNEAGWNSVSSIIADVESCP